MVHSCIVPGCHSRSDLPSCTHLSWYRLPHSNPLLLQKWMDNIGQAIDSVSEHTRICSLHFLNGERQSFDDVLILSPWNQYHASRPPPRERSTPPPRKKRMINKAKLAAINHDHTYALKSSIPDLFLSHIDHDIVDVTLSQKPSSR